MLRARFYRLAATALLFSWILLVQTLPGSWADDLEISLDPDLDQIGGQIETIQVYQHGEDEWMTFGLYDTGASVIAISYVDQFFYDFLGDPAIPVLVTNGAVAQGIDGVLTGNVSQMGTVSADGIHALTIDFDTLDFTFDLSTMTHVPNVQTFLGTENGSPELPTITGTPIHSAGMAARIDMQAYQLDLGDGFVFNLPDINFVDPGSSDADLTPTSITPTPVRIPLQLIGDNNYANPGNDVTAVQNPIQNSVTLRQGLNPDNVSYAANVTGKTFLFDTGAQISIINEELALDLGIDLENDWIETIQVQGAAGNTIDVSCYVVDILELPRDDNGDAVIDDATLNLYNVPVFVLDLTDFGLDGILGMNLWNSVQEMLYDPTDPNDPYLSMTFSDNHIDQLTLTEMEELQTTMDTLTDLLEELDPSSDLLPAIVSGLGLLNNISSLHITDMPPSAPVPEPSTWALLIMAVAGLLLHLLRRQAD